MGRARKLTGRVNWRRMTMREAIIQYWPESSGREADDGGFRFA